jgi:ribosomal-protein-alanine N-acetyltransferase
MLTIKFDPFPTLVTERTTLRRLEAGDDEAIFRLRSDATVSEFLTRKLSTSIEEARAFIEMITKNIDNNESAYWAIVPKNENDLVGTICLWHISIENHRAEIGYELMPSYQGKGLMQEALAAVVNYAFHDLKLHSLEATVSPENFSSIRLLEKSGFVREALFRGNCFYNGKFIDSAVYSRINS